MVGGNIVGGTSATAGNSAGGDAISVATASNTGSDTINILFTAASNVTGGLVRTITVVTTMLVVMVLQQTRLKTSILQLPLLRQTLHSARVVRQTRVQQQHLLVKTFA